MSTPTLISLAAAVATALVAVILVAFRRPVPRRLALRSARRRPVETGLVMLGALLGTVIITGSLTVGDTLDSSLRSGAFTHLGPVDETVTAPGTGALPALRDALAGLDDQRPVNGLAFGLQASGTAAAHREGRDPAVQPDVSLLELDFEEATRVGADPAATGFADAQTPLEGEVAISADLAEELDVETGGEVTVFAYDTSRVFEVDAVLPRRGLAGFNTGLGARSLNVFVPPGTIEQLAAGASSAVTAAPPITLAFVSNAGDVLSGVDRTDRVTELINARLEAVPQASVTRNKEQLLDTAEQVGSNLSRVFLGIGAFAVVAGVLLLVNVFVILAQERRRQLGIMRAVGMQRRSMVLAFFLEGSLYAVGAAVLGAAAGIGVGAGIVQVAQGISGGPAGFTLDLRFDVQLTSVLGGLLIGLILSLLTILATSIRVSRLNIIRAIRELAEPPRRRRRARVLVASWAAAVTGAATTVAAAASASGTGLLLGPVLLAVGLVDILGPLGGRRRLVTLVGLLVVVWGISAPTIVSEAFRNAQIGVFVAQGLVVTGAAVVVLANNQARIGRLIRRAAGGSGSITARLGLAYPMARPFRTTMTLAMYALVVFTLVLVSLFAQVFGGQTKAFAQAESGGFELLVTSVATNPLPPRTVRQRDGVDTVAGLRHAEFTVEFRAPGAREFRRWFASGYDHRLLQAEPPALDRWSQQFAEPGDVWRHVLDDPSIMIVSSRFLQEGGTPQAVDLGDTVDMRDPIAGETTRRTVVGVLEGGFAFSGAFMSQESISAAFGPRVPLNRLYVDVVDRAEPTAIAEDLEEDHIPQGVEARTFQDIVGDRQQQNRQFLRILQGYLTLGLLIGTAGLGVIMVRAVRERRRQIGMLRSVGLQSRTVSRAFMLEAAFVALQGIIVGTTLATATGYQLISNAAALGGLEVRFQMPWAEIGVLLVITLTASIAATGWPARRASHIQPAAALRGIE